MVNLSFSPLLKAYLPIKNSSIFNTTNRIIFRTKFKIYFRPKFSFNLANRSLTCLVLSPGLPPSALTSLSEI